MNTTELHHAINTYFELVHEYYANGSEQITFHKGYWWTSQNRQLNALEKSFIALGSDWCTLRTIWNDVKTVPQRASVLHLFGWSTCYQETVPILIQHLKDPSIEVSNAAARALFPIVVSKKYFIDIAHVRLLLHRRSVYHKNKALGLLLYWPHPHELRSLTKNDVRHIHALAMHEAPRYTPLAQALLKQIDKIRHKET